MMSLSAFLIRLNFVRVFTFVQNIVLYWKDRLIILNVKNFKENEVSKHAKGLLRVRVYST